MENHTPRISDVPVGRENALSRDELMRKWNLSDRMVRREIASLRAEDNGDDYVIVSYSSGNGGYYRTDDLDEIRHFVNEQSKRARNTFKPLRKARRILKGDMCVDKYGR